MSRSRRRVRWLFLFVFLIVAAPILLAWMALDRAPLTPLRPVPTVDEVVAARNLFRTFRQGPQTKVRTIDLSVAEAQSVLTLGAQSLPVERLSFQHAGDHYNVGASVPVRYGYWLNLTAAVPGSAQGFPDARVKAGRLVLPQFLSRWLMGKAYQRLNERVGGLPPPDELVKALTIAPDRVSATVTLPDRFVLTVPTALIAAEVCRMEAVVAGPGPYPFTALLHHGFRDHAGTPEANRISLIALAFVMAPDRAPMIFGDGDGAMRTCLGAEPNVRLLGRLDLAQHWAMSAALATTIGGDYSQEVGVWKELADTAPKGSGFSFVDLAADRSGQRKGLRAVDPARAAAVAAQLGTIEEAQLLPTKALALAENMKGGSFEEKFRSIDSPEYKAMIARIDAELATLP